MYIKRIKLPMYLSKFLPLILKYQSLNYYIHCYIQDLVRSTFRHYHIASFEQDMNFYHKIRVYQVNPFHMDLFQKNFVLQNFFTQKLEISKKMILLTNSKSSLYTS